MTPDRHSSGRGFTLVELAVSVAIMAVLMGAMGSVVLLASHALPDGQSPLEKKTQAADIVDRIAGDLVYAMTFIFSDADTVRFTVPDRGHGAAGPESLRYSWSGTPGDPLTHRYNGSPDVTLCADVRDFSLEYVRRAMPLRETPRVLLIVDDDLSLTTQDDAKLQMLESWGFQVRVLSDHGTLAEQQAALQDADVVYLAQDALEVPAFLGLNPAVGIVCEERSLFPDVGISQSSNWLWIDSIDIVDNTHEITKPFALGTLRIFSAGDEAIYSFLEIASGGRNLATDPTGNYEIMVAIDVDGVLFGGGSAPARRVSLPWGDMSFDFNGLTKDGLTLMRRAVVWAAAPVGVASVRITLQLGADPSGRVETQVQLLNLPRAP